MASYNELNALIDAYINRNGIQAITGQILNGVLKAMVEQLGRGYTIMGAAIPTTDPGTPDGPECYFASETGTYTDFDGLQVVPGELALLCYTPTDGWTKETIYEGFQTVQATIDGNVGTPSVGVSYANGVLSFDFRNMKGNTGDAAGFGTIGADITGGVGTPGVTVESSGPATAKNLQFHFTNLKGETGVTSVVATVDNTTGTPACTVSLVGQQLTLAFSGLKGAQGDTGSSVDYPFTIVNNLTTDDATQALSAAMGVQLEAEVSQLEAKVTDLQDGETVLQQQIDAIHPVIIEGNVENAPDNEDITATPDNRLKFANRSATLTNKGYKILRADKTFASQVTDINTIYEIRYAFDLGGEEFEIPSGCVLMFNGGQISNGTLKLQNTRIEAYGKCFSSVTIDGESTINNSEICLSWFAKDDEDCADVLDNIANLSIPLFFDIKAVSISHPVQLTARSRQIRGLSKAGKANADSSAAGNTRISPTIGFSAGNLENAMFVISANQACCDIRGIDFWGNYQVSCALFTKASLSGIIRDCTFRRFYGAAIAINSGTEQVSIKDNSCVQCGCFVWLSGGTYDDTNLLAIQDSGAAAMVEISGNYVIYCNYGVLFVAGSDIQILRNCISHIACYAIYGKTHKIALINGNYFEGPGRSDFWIDQNGQTDATEFTTATHLLTSHKGENNEDVAGWGIGTNQIRPAIFVANNGDITANDGLRCYVQIKNNTTSLNWIRTPIGANYTNDQQVAGLDAFAVCGTMKVEIDANNIPMSAVNYSHYGQAVAPKYIIYNDNSYDFRSAGIYQSAFNAFGNNAVPEYYNGTPWLGSRMLMLFAINNPYVNNGFKSEYNPNFPDMFNSVRCSNNNAFGNVYNNVDSIIDERGIRFFRPQVNAGGTLRWLYIKVPTSFIKGTLVGELYLKNNETSSVSINLLMQDASSTTIESSGNIPLAGNGVIRKCLFIIDKERLGATAHIIFRIQIPNKDVYTSLLFLNTLDGKRNGQLLGMGCDIMGFLKSGNTQNRPPVSLVPVGQTYLDTDLGKMIISNGTAWVNMDGTALS